ncbi:Protein of unknown function [Robiginitalea myxolifaciens]|uniref:DinB superfamily protein n=1 Tax=Robiginitalea myxolifaciens TaxID=400055 RepID=A0A1I6HD72_9FLAO|nr:DUF1572 family protein [Robiginitalea myxolifaciens]SFR52280.1 Protein of unknown function [Robiginitalea myxolifaciens]
MVTHALEKIFTRDLLRLKTEIESYKEEENLWIVEQSISNSAGNLCLHLVGNLNAYIGEGLARSGYVRQRDREFADKHVPRETLLRQIDDTIPVVQAGLRAVTEEQMKGDFPIQIWKEPTPMEFTLIHLATHLNYHLGQINYHRRLLD